MTTRIALVALALTMTACGRGNVCERRLALEEEVCFPELEQPHSVDDDDCRDTDKVVSECAVRNEDAFCDWFLWQNRGAARQAGHVVPDYLTPGNDYVECLQDAGLQE